MIDLSRLKEITDGRILYKRAKTGTQYSIKVEPEALEIINRYKGSEHLISFFDKEHYLFRQSSMNKSLKLMCQELHLPKISVYWARHSFATIAYEIGIPIDIIADCLGHKTVHKITNIYIRKDLSKIDEANRKVINYVLYNIK